MKKNLGFLDQIIFKYAEERNPITGDDDETFDEIKLESTINMDQIESFRELYPGESETVEKGIVIYYKSGHVLTYAIHYQRFLNFYQSCFEEKK